MGEIEDQDGSSVRPSTKKTSRFRRRPQYASPQKQDARNEGDSSSRQESSDNLERATSTDTTTTNTNTSLFGGDKRQKTIIYREFSENPFEVLKGVAADIPQPESEHDVVIKVSASTVSYNDCMIRRGICFDVINPTDLPAAPGMDVVGNILQVGSNVRKFKVGDRVAALVRTGGNARYISVPGDSLISVPRSCDAAEAVCMVSTYMTAYQALRLVTNDNFSLNGKRILVTGGIEPVGQALIQLCFRAGAEEVYATAPDHRHRYIKSILGAHPLPVDPEKWLTKFKGSMDIVFDGTCVDNLESPYASLKDDGTLVCLGMSALLNREKPGFFGAPLSAYWAKLKGSVMHNTKSYEVWNSFSGDKEAFKLDLEILFHLLKKRFIKPHIAKRISLSEVAEAQESLEQETARGQICVLPWKRISSG